MISSNFLVRVIKPQPPPWWGKVSKHHLSGFNMSCQRLCFIHSIIKSSQSDSDFASVPSPACFLSCLSIVILPLQKKTFFFLPSLTSTKICQVVFKSAYLGVNTESLSLRFEVGLNQKVELWNGVLRIKWALPSCTQGRLDIRSWCPQSQHQCWCWWALRIASWCQGSSPPPGDRIWTSELRPPSRNALQHPRAMV